MSRPRCRAHIDGSTRWGYYKNAKMPPMPVNVRGEGTGGSGRHSGRREPGWPNGERTGNSRHTHARVSERESVNACVNKQEIRLRTIIVITALSRLYMPIRTCQFLMRVEIVFLDQSASTRHDLTFFSYEQR